MPRPMSDFSARSRERLLTAGIPHTSEPFDPENLPRIQYEMHGETTVDQRATEMLRKPTEAEIKQIGSEYRSDLNPHNYRSEGIWLPDTPLNTSYRAEIQTDFSVWAVSISRGPILTESPAVPNIQYPQASIYLLPWNKEITFNNFLNLPYGLANKASFIVLNINGASPGGGVMVYAHDRWLPSMAQ